jgi:DNA-binding transcriptional regulator YiaG
MTAAAGVAAARARHPNGVSRPGLLALAERIERQLAGEDHPYPDFAAALLALRGERGLDQAEFAAVIGVRASVLRALERGVLAPLEAPPRLANLVTAFRREAA